jgi:hypothetical protein
MNRTQKRRWNDLEVLRTKALLDAAQIAHEQARIASQEATEAGGATGTPGAVPLVARRQREAIKNRDRILTYLGTIPEGQPGRIREAKTALKLSVNTIKKHVSEMAGFRVHNGLILRTKFDV